MSQTRLVLIILAVVAVVAVAPLLFHVGPAPTKPNVDGQPWQISTTPEGNSRVFGLTLGVSTLDEARSRLGPDVQIGIIANGEEAGTLEAYQDSLPPGFVGGRIIITGDLPESVIKDIKTRSKGKYMASGAQRFTLAAEDLPTALKAPIKALSFIPSVNLDAQMVIDRFGQPAERIKTAAKTEHLLYPGKGLDAIVDGEGKELLQYVPPRNFANLRAPLKPIAESK